MAMWVLVAALGACTQTQPTRFYTLSSVSGEQAAPAAPAAPAATGATGADAPKVVVGPVTLPKYLDRPQLVTRPSAYVVDVAEFNRWAEPLEDLVPRVIAQNIAAMTGSEQVFLSSRQRLSDVPYRVEITFYRFDIDADDQAMLIALWEVIDRERDRVVVTRKSTIAAQPASAPYEGVAEAMSETLAILSRQIADALLALPKRS
jgi:uncharacterized lipoprotein YmbA